MMYELIYHSIATPDLKLSEVFDILEKARKFNQENNITGCLLFYDNSFAQILEGEEKVIKDLYEKIKLDPRHSHISLIKEASIEKRIFEEWNMAFENFKKVKIIDLSNHMNMGRFNKLIEVMDKPTDAKELFYCVSKNIVENIS